VAAEAPALDAAAGDVARADDDVRAVVERLDERREVLDVVREVRVHLEEAVVPLDEALLERLDVCGAKPQLARPVHDANVLVLCRDAVGQIARAVGRVVVDDHQVRLGVGRTHRVDEAGQVVLLVVSRGDDEGSGQGERSFYTTRSERDPV